VWGQGLKPTFENFSPTTRNLVGEKPKNFADHYQVEACNFETAQHTNKQSRSHPEMVGNMSHVTATSASRPV